MTVEERERLILERLPQVLFVARPIYRRCPPNEELDDLISEGTLGLIAAVDRFDAGRGLKLQTYAEHKIRGAILDYLRRQNPNRSHRWQEDRAVAGNLSAIQGVHVQSLDAILHLPDPDDSPLVSLCRKERRRLLAVGIARLPEHQRTVLQLYCAEMPLREIAHVVNRSENLVYVTKARAISRLRPMVGHAANRRAGSALAGGGGVRIET